MQKQIKTFLVLAMSAFFLLACTMSGFGVVRGSGNMVRETREVSDFNQVEMQGGGTLYLVQGDTESLEIEAEDNIMPYLRSRVIDGRLILDFDDTPRKAFSTTRTIKYHLTMKDIQGLSISGGGDIEAGPIVSEALTLNLSGGGDLKINSLTAEKLLVNVSGGGDIHILNGNVQEQGLQISGGGQYDAADLQSQTTTASVSGGGELIVWVEDTLTANISGGGNLYYYGSPILNSSISGGGDINRRER